MAKARCYWLMKSEPDAFGIDDLARKKREGWDGVRNYQARNNMRAMAVGDRVLFYHSNAAPPGVAGVAQVSRTAYPDPTQFDPDSKYFDPKATMANPRWEMVEVEFVEKLPRFVPLDVLKQDPELAGMVVTQKGSRLSVQPVAKAHFARVLKLAGSTLRG